MTFKFSGCCKLDRMFIRCSMTNDYPRYLHLTTWISPRQHVWKVEPLHEEISLLRNCMVLDRWVRTIEKGMILALAAKARIVPLRLRQTIWWRWYVMKINIFFLAKGVLWSRSFFNLFTEKIRPLATVTFFVPRSILTVEGLCRAAARKRGQKLKVTKMKREGVLLLAGAYCEGYYRDILSPAKL